MLFVFGKESAKGDKAEVHMHFAHSCCAINCEPIWNGHHFLQLFDLLVKRYFSKVLYFTALQTCRWSMPAKKKKNAAAVLQAQVHYF
jgi:hypothetical protein